MAGLNEDMDDIISSLLQRMNIDSISASQELVIKSYLGGKDVLFSSPTGDKSITYKLAPQIFKEYAKTEIATVLVVSSESTLRTQTEKCLSMGMKAVFLEEPDTYKRKRPPRLDGSLMATMGNMTYDDIRNGKADIIFASPVAILGKYRDLVLDLGGYKSKHIKAIFIDEAQNIRKVGPADDVWLPGYGEIGELRSLAQVPVIAMAPPVSPKTQKVIREQLCFRDHEEVIVSPNNPNTRFAMCQATGKIERDFAWLVELLHEKGKDCPRIIIFMQVMDNISELYMFLNRELKKHGYVDSKPEGPNGTTNRMYDMLHICTTGDIREIILSSLRDPNGSTRVVVVDSPFRMGPDIKGVDYVIHYGPSETVEEYFQQTENEVVRREETQFHAILVTFKRCLAPPSIWMPKVKVRKCMKEYVEGTSCRRAQLLQNMESSSSDVKPDHRCCDVCSMKCKCLCQCETGCHCEGGCNLGTSAIIELIKDQENMENSDDSDLSDSDMDENTSARGEDGNTSAQNVEENMSDSEVDEYTSDIIRSALSRMNIEKIDAHQQKVIQSYLHGKDVLFSTPTITGDKSVTYELAPQLFKQYSKTEIATVLVVSTPESSLRTQTEKCLSMGMKAVFLEDPDTYKRKRPPRLDGSLMATMGNMTYDDIRNGKADIIFASPVAILGKYRDLVLDLGGFKVEHIKAIFIDEAHNIQKVGPAEDVWLPGYGELGELRSLAQVPVIAMAPSVSLETRQVIREKLCLHSCKNILGSPNNPNTKYWMMEVKGDVECDFVWLVDLLHEEGKNAPRIIIYMQLMEQIANMYSYLIGELEDHSYVNNKPEGPNGTTNRIFDMLHSCTTKGVTEVILSSLRDPNGCRRVVMVDSPFRMGPDVKGVDYVIHYGPAQTVEDYLQETTSEVAITQEKQFHAILMKYKKCLKPPTIWQRKKVHNCMKEYVEGTSCRRAQLLQNMEKSSSEVKPDHRCCDVCSLKCKCLCQCETACHCEGGCNLGTSAIIEEMKSLENIVYSDVSDSDEESTSNSDEAENSSDSYRGAYVGRRPMLASCSDSDDDYYSDFY